MGINCNDLRRSSPLPLDSGSMVSSLSVSFNSNNKRPEARVLASGGGDDSIRCSIYQSLEQRGFDAVCLIGASDADVIDFVSRVSPSVMKRMTSACLRSSSVSDKGLEIFLSSMNQSLVRLQLTGRTIPHKD